MPTNERLATLGQGKTRYFLVSLLLLLPCYWQPRLQAGDISSHIYNAWLSQVIESGRTQGLMMVQQTTNILFDLMLAGLFRIVGPELAQRFAVSLAVLAFAWGAFYFITTVSGRRPWHLMPCIAMLAYGWVFHMGFFDFYLSLGLCFWAMAIAWNLTVRRLAFAAPVLVLAWFAHALPVIWAFGILTYLHVARPMRPLPRACLTATVVGVLIGFHGLMSRITDIRWSPAQLTLSTGLDQVWVFDTKYYWVLMGLLAIWALQFLALVHRSGVRDVVGGIPFHLCVISAAAVFVLPGTVLIPGFYHALSYIAERMSLGVAICVCAMLASVPPRMLDRCALIAVALTFFAFIYADERNLNSFEDRMQDVVSHATPRVQVAPRPGAVSGRRTATN